MKTIEKIVYEELEKITKKHNLIGDVIVEKPRDELMGDFSTNFALINAKKNNMKPMELAEKFVEYLKGNKSIEKVEIVKPGFINIFVFEKILQNAIGNVNSLKQNYGKGEDKKYTYNLEIVSANPTGYLHIGHARNGAIGDSVARILRFAGYKVETEYYVNDAGNQINIAAVTLFYYYKKLQNVEVEQPEEMYGGDMYGEVAKILIDKFGDKYLDCTFVDNKISDLKVHELFKNEAVTLFMTEIKKQLKDFEVEVQWYSSEAKMYETHQIEKILKIFEDKKSIYQKDGATWLKTTLFGDDKDRVLIKENGDYTYITPDIASHHVRIQRSGANKYVNFWGGDHHGYIKRVNASLELLGHPKDILEIDTIQMVRLIKDGKELKMSKRCGTAVWLVDLLEMVGKDCVRYMLVSKAGSTHMDFNLDVALQKTSANPVYYAQYAVARCHKIVEKAIKDKIKYLDNLLNQKINEKERQLILTIDQFPKIVQNAAKLRLPNLIADYIQNLAKRLHSYYGDEKIFGLSDNKLISQKIAIINAVKQVLTNAFNLIGIEAVENM